MIANNISKILKNGLGFGRQKIWKIFWMTMNDRSERKEV
jgi:hypothetical protein